MLPLIAVLLASVSAARAQDPAVRGRVLLKEFCSRCHAIGKAGHSPNRVAPPLCGSR
jgi:cytochrome c2